MLRRTLRRMMAESLDDMPADKLQRVKEAYMMFGFTDFGAPVEKLELKKRYNDLAMRAHPDRGGTPDRFLKLQENYKIMQDFKMDSHRVRPKVKVTFNNKTYDDITNTIHRHRQEETLRLDVTDALAILVVLPLGILLWYYYAWDNATRLSDARSRMTEKELKPAPINESKVEWHPWRANPDLHEEVAQLDAQRLRRMGRVGSDLDAASGAPPSLRPASASPFAVSRAAVAQ